MPPRRSSCCDGEGGRGREADGGAANTVGPPDNCVSGSRSALGGQRGRCCLIAHCGAGRRGRPTRAGPHPVPLPESVTMTVGCPRSPSDFSSADWRSSTWRCMRDTFGRGGGGRGGRGGGGRGAWLPCGTAAGTGIRAGRPQQQPRRAPQAPRADPRRAPHLGHLRRALALERVKQAGRHVLGREAAALLVDVVRRRARGAAHQAPQHRHGWQRGSRARPRSAALCEAAAAARGGATPKRRSSGPALAQRQRPAPAPAPLPELEPHLSEVVPAGF
jgi:hypothetical protein